MADRIQLRRDTAANWTSVNPILTQGELGVETDTNKFKVGNGTSNWVSLSYLIDTANYITTTSSNTLTNKLMSTGSTWQGTAVAVLYGGTGATTAAGALTNLGAYASSNPSGYTTNTGTVTSVGGTGTVSGLSLSGTVTTTGNLTLGGTLAVTASNFASQTANTILAAPSGSAGVPTFRALTTVDIPTLNQNTTGSAASVSGTTTAAVTSSALGSGTANSTTYLRGDRTWATVQGGATVSDDTTTDATRYIVWEDVTTGSSTTIGVSSTKLYFNPSTGTLNATNFNSLSDISKKTNVIEIGNATDTINKIVGVEFDWLENNTKSAGVIAQELEKILPHLVSETDGIKSVNYSGLIAYLIQSNKELHSRISVLENK